MDSKPGVPWKVQVMNLSLSPKYFKSGAKYGYIDEYEGSVVAVTFNRGVTGGMKPEKEKDKAKSAASPRPYVDMEIVPLKLWVQMERI
eukprot:contig_16166_g3895